MERTGRGGDAPRGLGAQHGNQALLSSFDAVVNRLYEAMLDSKNDVVAGEPECAPR